MLPTNQTPPNNGQDDDKTIIYSSSENISGKKDNPEKTTISSDSEKTQFQETTIPKQNVAAPSNNSDMEKTQIQNSQSASSQATNEKSAPQNPVSGTSNPPTNKLEELKGKSTDNKVSTGLFAAGVAGAAIGGTAFGAGFSDEIKEAFAAETVNAPESPESDPQEVTPQQGTSVNGEGQTNDSHPMNTSFDGGQGTENPNASIPQDQSSSFEISSTDANGNVYNVSFVDIDGDGDIDSQSGNIHFVDGTSVSFTQNGDNISPLFNGRPEFASIQDYHAEPDFTNLVYPANALGTDSSTHVYEIQAGDTLSEIAESNHTSIENLLELNPDITDPNLIYAGDNLVIPDNDNISNPYEVASDLGDVAQPAETTEAIVSDYSDYTTVPDDSLTETVEAIELDDSDYQAISDDPLMEQVDGGDFEQVDWASFSDDAPSVDNEVYGEELAQTDFDSYETPDSYTDYGSNDYGINDVSADFM